MKTKTAKIFSAVLLIMTLCLFLLPAAACGSEEAAVTGIKMEAEKSLLITGDIQYLSVKFFPEDAYAQVAWSSSDDRVIKIDGQGKMIAVGEGVATVTVTTADVEYSDSREFTVRDIMLGSYDLTLVEGTIYKGLSVDGITDHSVIGVDYDAVSADPSIAYAVKGGIIKAEAPGTTQITFTKKSDGRRTACIVTVEAYVPEEPFAFGDEWMTGEMLTIEEAFENGYIDHDDLTNMAYYCDIVMSPNDFTADFTAEPLYPKELPEELMSVIEDAFIEWVIAVNPGTEKYDEVMSMEYLGRYGDCIAIKGSRSLGLTGAVYDVYPITVDGVSFNIDPGESYPLIWHRA